MSVYVNRFVVRFSVGFVRTFDKSKVMSRKLVLSWLA